MEAGKDRITLKIDVNAGTIELDAPAASFDQAIERTRELTGSLEFGRQAATSRCRRANPSGQAVARQSIRATSQDRN